MAELILGQVLSTEFLVDLREGTSLLASWPLPIVIRRGNTAQTSPMNGARDALSSLNPAFSK